MFKKEGKKEKRKEKREWKEKSVRLKRIFVVGLTKVTTGFLKTLRARVCYLSF